MKKYPKGFDLGVVVTFLILFTSLAFAAQKARFSDLVVDNTVTLLDNVVDGAALVDNTASGTKLIDNTVASSKLLDNSITSLKVLDNTLTIEKIAHTGTPDNTTFLRGDGEFAVPAAFTTKVCNLSLSGNQSVTGGNTDNVLWNVEDSDVLDAHTAGADNAAIIVPTGYAWVNLYVAINWSAIGAGGASRQMTLLKNGTGIALQLNNPWGTLPSSNMITTGWLPVSVNDKFTVQVYTANTAGVLQAYSYFRAEFR